MNHSNFNGKQASVSTDDSRRGGTNFDLLSALRETLSEDPHLSDAEMIELSAGMIEPDLEPPLLAHVDRCATCAGDLKNLRASLESWNNASALQRREERIGRAAAMSTAADSDDTWWRRRIADLVSIAPLRPAVGAMAAGEDIGVVHFSIYDGESAVIGLSGVVQRRRQAYYVHLTASPSLGRDYTGRQVEVVLVDPESGKTLVNRKTSFDEFVLLGTNLQIGSQKIAARLLP